VVPGRYKFLALRLELDRFSVSGIYNLGLNYLAAKTFPARAPNRLTAVQLESTLACNIKCRMCVRDYFDRKGAHLTFDNFKKIIDQFPFLRQLNLTGIGEPLLNKDIFRMVEYAVGKRKLYVRFTTNATLLTPQNNERLIRSGLNELRVSLDGATAGTFNKIREGSDFEKVVDNIRGLTRLKNDLGAQKPVIEVNTVVLRENIDELPRIVALASWLNIKNIFFTGLDIEGAKYAQKKHLIYNLPRHEIEAVFRETRRRARELGVAIRLPNLIPQPRRCFLPWLINYITLEGDLMPCCRCIDGLDRRDVIRDYSFGNLLRQRLDDVWNSKKYQDFRKRLSNGKVPYICRNCTVALGMD
jgi:radical SAM protein with 4Fe4S-binding SPASM domain